MLKQLKQALFQVLESSQKKIDFKNVNYLPRWAILCVDSFILVISLFFTKIIVSKIKNAAFFN